MQFEANIIQKSIGEENGVVIGTAELVYPRVILAEVNTHRVVSKNGASSRAIPFDRMVAAMRDNYFRPLKWLQNQPGMVTTEVMDGFYADECDEIWTSAMESAILHAKMLHKRKASKQYTNRLLEPFMMTRTLITTTRIANLFALRDHPDAMPEFQLLASMLKENWEKEDPIVRSCHEPMGGWHMPYIDGPDWDTARIYAVDGCGEEPVIPSHAMAPTDHNGMKTLLAMSIARCCRVSGKTFAGEHPDLEADFRTFSRLNTSPLHASPMEHQAYPLPTAHHIPSITGNLHGWVQCRKLMPNEAVEEINFARAA
jgi:hypothetical protein